MRGTITSHTSFLTVNNGAKAIEFYVRAFDAEARDFLLNGAIDAEDCKIIKADSEKDIIDVEQ